VKSGFYVNYQAGERIPTSEGPCRIGGTGRGRGYRGCDHRKLSVQVEGGYSFSIMIGQGRAIAMLCAATLSTLLTGPRGYAQDLRIVSPVSGDVVAEGQPLKIVVAADDSVRMVYVMGWTPLPSVRPIGNNVFEMDIPKTVPAGKYQLTALGVTTAPVYSTPVEIQIEREDLPVALKVPSTERATKAGVPFPLINADFSFPFFVQAEFADGSKTDVTRSVKTTFESKDPAVVTVDEKPGLVGHGPGVTTIVVGYAGQVYTTILVAGPGTPHGTRVFPFPSYHGTEHAGSELGMSPYSTTQKSSFATHPGFSIEAVLGAVMPGKRIRITGSGFTSEQGTGFVTVGGVKAEVVTWTTKEIAVIVPQFTAVTRTATISVHQDNASEDFPVKLP
jgi:IPT/TIG domain-containing protein